jgi:hypothetical protein
MIFLSAACGCAADSAEVKNCRYMRISLAKSQTRKVNRVFTGWTNRRAGRVSVRSWFGSIDTSACEAPKEPSPLPSVSESARLHGVLDQTSIAQFRATLPWAAERNREEVRALLDHCLHNSKTALRRLDLVDYVVTILSTRVENGMRHVVRDPWKVSTRLQAVCTMVQEQMGDELGEVDLRLREAIAELADLEDVACVVDEVRKIKRSIGKGFFQPSILHRIVEFNAAVSNHFESLLDAERAMDDDIVRYFRVQ